VGGIPFGNELVKIGCGYGDKGLEEDDDDPFALSGDEMGIRLRRLMMKTRREETCPHKQSSS